MVQNGHWTHYSWKLVLNDDDNNKDDEDDDGWDESSSLIFVRFSGTYIIGPNPCSPPEQGKEVIGDFFFPA